MRTQDPRGVDSRGQRRLALARMLVAATGARHAPHAARAAAQATRITVWLHDDAQSSWPKRRRRRDHGVPGEAPRRRRQRSQYQSWGDHLTKFDATLAGGNAPGRGRARQHRDRRSTWRPARSPTARQGRRSPTRSTWLRASRRRATYNGKLYGVPYYAGARARHLPHGLYKAGRDQDGRRRASPSSSRTAPKLMAKYGKKTRTSPPSTSRAGTGTPRCRSSTTTAARSPRRARASGSARSTRRRRSPGLTSLEGRRR